MYKNYFSVFDIFLWRILSLVLQKICGVMYFLVRCFVRVRTFLLTIKCSERSNSINLFDELYGDRIHPKDWVMGSDERYANAKNREKQYYEIMEEKLFNRELK